VRTLGHLVIAENAWSEQPAIIVVAPTGAEATRDQSPAIPYTPAEIATSVIDSWREGASVAHLHVREPDGTPSGKHELFAESIRLIREGCDIVTMVSTGGGAGMSITERTGGLGAGPEMTGIEVGSINFGDELFPTLPAQTQAIAEAARAKGIALEVEAFELGHVDTARRLSESGVLHGRLRLNLVLGVPGALAATSHNLIAAAGAVPADAVWGVTAVGRHQRRMLSLGLLLGATSVRVGLEDSLYVRRGELASSNGQLVRGLASLAQDLGREIANPEAARRLLDL
jgi:3-keto-5-aminohexanoate cleavage enzyme